MRYHGAKSTSCLSTNPKSKIRAEVDVLKKLKKRNFYKCQAMVIKFGGNVNDRCGNLTKKTEHKSADSEHHLVVIPGTFRSRWYMDRYRRKSARTECDIKKINVMQILILYRGNRRFII